MMKMKKMILVAVLIPVFSLNASAAQPAQTPAINIYVDVLLGVISEDEAKEKIESLKHDFKSTLKLETDGLTGDLYGFRQLTGKQFAALVSRIGEITSFSSIQKVGKTDARAYLEVKVFLTSSKEYVAIVCSTLNDLPDDIRKKF